MNTLAITTLAPGPVINAVYFLDGHEISEREYFAVQNAAIARAYDGDSE